MKYLLLFVCILFSSLMGHAQQRQDSIAQKVDTLDTLSQQLGHNQKIASPNFPLIALECFEGEGE